MLINLFLIPFLSLVIFLQVFYLVNSLLLIPRKKQAHKKVVLPTKKITTIVPLFNSETTIDKCLASLLRNNSRAIEKVILVLDHCKDNSENIAKLSAEKFSKKNIVFKIVRLKRGLSGKTSALLAGIKHAKTANILLLDADILLAKNAVQKMLQFHLKNKNLYSTCLIYPQPQKHPTLISQLICNDRLYRQNILQIVRNKYDVSNFPGGVAIVNAQKYKRFLKKGFLEDLSATYQILSSQNKVSLLPKVLAYEVERQSIKGLFFQRIRWTMGNIENIYQLKRAVLSNKSLLKKTLILSYPLMWYFQHYFITMGLMFFLISQSFIKFIYIIPLLAYSGQVFFSSQINKGLYKSTAPGLILHCVFFPLIVTAALFGALITLFIKKKFYFKTDILFNRI